ncbi:hypothetical protein [Oceanobacillus salinisoli]|uniref:hypothetical protein n=1 Tax=Oceanobacillus salinisoli TaxID=2678611 RepID=UPI0012E2BED3|nr:hypothetical protein [Oceanobacillus salinisoli]
MRSVKMSKIERNIKTNRQNVNAQIQETHNKYPRIRRSRPRDFDERNALTQITKASIERAKRDGKMKMIGKQKMYYDPTE